MFNIFVPFFVLSVLIHQPSLAQNNYCEISTLHTLCQYQGFGPTCGDRSALPRGVSESEKVEIVNLHNKLRARVARGEEVRGISGPQPPAANMMELVWDEELAAIAQRWADQCVFGHDTNRNVPRFRVGQNAFLAGNTQPAPVNWGQAVLGWYDEVKMVDRNIVDSFAFSSSTGHYTQMVWASTSTIGCGSTSYRNGRFIQNLIICNYGEGGNLIGAPMYAKGESCSRCPGGSTCSSRNNGLCSQTRSRPSTQSFPSSTPEIASLPISTPINAPIPDQILSQGNGVSSTPNEENLNRPRPTFSTIITTPSQSRPRPFSFMRPVNGMFNRFFTFFG